MLSVVEQSWLVTELFLPCSLRMPRLVRFLQWVNTAGTDGTTQEH